MYNFDINTGFLKYATRFHGSGHSVGSYSIKKSLEIIAVNLKLHSSATPLDNRDRQSLLLPYSVFPRNILPKEIH